MCIRDRHSSSPAAPGPLGCDRTAPQPTLPPAPPPPLALTSQLPPPPPEITVEGNLDYGTSGV
eukprot:248644-Alexandrium_andersonii.AAC.1